MTKKEHKQEKWKEKEITLLNNLFKTEITIKKLSQLLNRSEKSIISKARKLKLYRIKRTIGWKLSKKVKKQQSKNKLNDKNPMWKGEKVGYNALHNWVRRRKPKPDC